MTTKKEKLLNEGTIRRFMTLANLDALSENFMDANPIKEEDEEIKEEEETTTEVKEDTVAEEEVKLDEMMPGEEEEEVPVDMEEPEEELPGEEDAEMGDAQTVELSDDDIAALAQASTVLQKLVGTEAPGEMPADDLDAPVEEPPIDDEEILTGDEELSEQDKMMETIVQRVIAQLKEEAKASRK